jgi:ferredoxin
MAKIRLDRDKCIQCGACAAIAPDLFEMAQDGKSTLKNSKKPSENIEELEINDDKPQVLESAKQTAQACPNGAIEVEE